MDGLSGDGRSLWMRGRGLTELPAAVWELTDLRELSIGENPGLAVPEPIGELGTLTRLYLDGMGLTTVPDSISRLRAWRCWISATTR